MGVANEGVSYHYPPHSFPFIKLSRLLKEIVIIVNKNQSPSDFRLRDINFALQKSE